MEVPMCKAALVVAATLVFCAPIAGACPLSHSGGSGKAIVIPKKQGGGDIRARFSPVKDAPQDSPRRHVARGTSGSAGATPIRVR